MRCVWVGDFLIYENAELTHLVGKIQPSMAADGHFAAQNVLLGTLASSPASPAPWLDFSVESSVW